MDENAIHQWMIECFGPIQGEMAWNQFSTLPESVRGQILAQNGGQLPNPDEVKAMISALTAGGLNTFGDMQEKVQDGPINVKFAQAIALGRAQVKNSVQTISASQSEKVANTMSQANLWLDAVCSFDPAPGQAQALTRTSWIEDTLDSWAKFAAPVANSMINALIEVLGSRFGSLPEGEVAGMFAGPIPIPMPENMRDPKKIISLLGNTSFSMQLGQAAGEMSSEVYGSFDQGIALLSNPAGGLIVQNVQEYAQSLEIDEEEVMSFLALHESAHARLFASVPWLMPRFEALIGKYARGVNVDLEAMQDQIDQAVSLDPESMAGAINLSKVGMQDTPEQEEAMRSLETLLALVEGWVDCVVWRSGMAYLPHIEQLREMMRRQRAVGGPSEQTFESLIGLKLRPKRLREAAEIWEQITSQTSPTDRDAMWSHPDLLPELPGDTQEKNNTDGQEASTGDSSTSATGETQSESTSTNHGSKTSKSIDWDAELSKLLENDKDNPQHKDEDQGDK